MHKHTDTDGHTQTYTPIRTHTYERGDQIYTPIESEYVSKYTVEVKDFSIFMINSDKGLISL